MNFYCDVCKIKYTPPINSFVFGYNKQWCMLCLESINPTLFNIYYKKEFEKVLDKV